ncbi:MAG TPA: FtsX-like permease family protein [Chitinophagaceae bacterium]|nr:FtsX-like permease family protein [Chitinophagaceae bacterium]
MIRNYFKIAWRNLFKNKVSSFINIGGLTVGIAVALLIGLWIYDELSFNKYHQNYHRIAQIMTRGNDPKEGLFINNSLQYPLATELRTAYKNNFKHIVRASWAQEYILSAGEKKLSSTGQFMDEDAPAMFTLKMLKGSWNGLKDPHSIMLSASTAKTLFGNADPMDQLVMINNKMNVKVSGVYEDLPLNTQFNNIKFFSTWNLWVSENDWINARATNDWHNHFLKLYAEIKLGADFESVNNNIKDVELRNIKNLENFQEDIARKPQVFLQPMSKWHLYPFTRNGITDDKPIRMVWLISIIGMFVLLLACINFMNLSTARSEKRAREVGIRKTMGSMRKQLVYQFFSESFLVVILSFVLACFVVIISLPWFNNLSSKQMNVPWNDANFWLMSTGFIFVTALLAGSYPALYLSSFKPVKVLKGTFRSGRLAAIPRKVLVVMQFTVSIALIISTVVVYRQVKFAKDRPVGYTREGLIMIKMKSDDFNGKYDLFRTEFLNTGVVTELSESMGKVTEVASGNNGFDWKGRDPNRDESFGTLAVTHEHGKTVGWQFIAGRDFSRAYSSDSAGVVINESAAKYMGLENPVGETITWKWHDNDPKPYKILGVIRDMVMESPYEPVEQTLFFIKPLNGGVNWINMRINPSVTMSSALPKIEAVFKKLVPAAPFDYKFVDQDYALKFAAEERISKLSGFFAALAIFISCLGLFGLASFVAEQRTKEIGVRKVLGASVFNVWQLLSKEFVLLVILSLLIAAPIAYYFMHDWLQNYQYRAELSWWLFAAAGAGALAITLLTVSFHAIKAAIANPVKSLRTE